MPYESGHRSLGVIDIGSNSVRMVIYDLAYNPPEKIFNEKVFCALGRDLASTGRLNAEAVSSAFKALRAYKLLSEIYQVEILRVVGTAALRDAIDGQSFIDRVNEEIALSIRIISGDEEAGFAARGVLVFDPYADGVVADFGGGSLEFARVYRNQVHDTVSLPLGAYRVQAMGNKARDNMLAYIEPLKPRFANLDALYAIGGSWRVLASSYMKDKGERENLQGYTIPTPDMIEFCKNIKGMTEQAIRETYRMESHHAKQATAAAFALELILKELAPREFVVSTAGVRDGVAHEFLLTDAKTK